MLTLQNLRWSGKQLLSAILQILQHNLRSGWTRAFGPRNSARYFGLPGDMWRDIVGRFKNTTPEMTPAPIFSLHPFPVSEILTGPPVRDRQLWRRTGNFLLIFLQFYVYVLRFKAWGPTTFLTKFQTLPISSRQCPKSYNQTLEDHYQVEVQLDGLWTRGRNRGQLEFRTHVVLKMAFQDCGNRTLTFPRWCPPNLQADARREAHRRICQFLIAETCSINFLIKFAKYLMLKACWLWFVIWKKLCGINQAEDRVTWPDLLHWHTSKLTSLREWLVVSAWLWIQAQVQNPC